MSQRKQSSIPKEKWPRFRVLIVGRANAGKTTILHKICNSTGEPEIRDLRGIKLALSFLIPTKMRGMHDIDKEMIFPSNPRFVFHDSRGFESGGTEELESVKKFLSKREKKRAVGEKLHAIWYCIPTDNPRLLTAAEISFFDECGTGEVPVIVIFTKFDHGDIAAFVQLQEEGLEWEEAKREAPRRAKTVFEQVHLRQIYERRYPPKKHVYLRDMDKPESTCGDLVEQTADALKDGFLKLLLVSTQWNNLEVCIKYAIKETIVPYIRKFDKLEFGEPHMRRLTSQVLAWFPRDLNDLDRAAEFFEKEQTSKLLDGREDLEEWGKEFHWLGEDEKYERDGRQYMHVLNNNTNELSPYLSFLAGSATPVLHQVMRLALGLTIVAEHSYSLPPLLRLQKSSQLYYGSKAEKVVSKAVGKVSLGDNLAEQLITTVSDNCL